MNEKSYNIALDCIDKNGQSLLNKHKPALIYIKEGAAPLRLTFSNLLGLTNRIANALKNLGLPKGDRLVLRLPNCPEFPVSFLGAIKAGLYPIPTSPQFTAQELGHILEDSEASVLVTTEELLPKEIEDQKNLKHILLIKSPSPQSSPLEGKGARRADEGKIHRLQDLLKNSSPEFITETTFENDPAFWLYTSGTEGKAKAVIHAHRSIPAHDTRAKLWQDLRFNDVIFNTSSLNWSYALTSGLLDVWRHGLPTIIYDGSLQAEKICHIIKHFGVTTFMSVPGIYRRLVEYWSLDKLGMSKNGHSEPVEPSPFSQVRICNSAGEKLPEEIRRKFKESTGLEIYEGLGMTEHSVYLAQTVGEPIVEGSCGKALPGNKIAIVDEQGNEVPPNIPGILASHRSCPGLMLGYRSGPVAPPSSVGAGPCACPKEGGHWEPPLQNRWFLSGDIAQQDEKGNFFFLGRRDDVITAGGYRISPLEVERALNSTAEVAESAVIGKELSPGKTQVIAFAILKEGIPQNEEIKNKILSQISSSLAKYKQVKEIVFVKDLPKTPNGKIKRKELHSWLIS